MYWLKLDHHTPDTTTYLTWKLGPQEEAQAALERQKQEVVHLQMRMQEAQVSHVRPT